MIYKANNAMFIEIHKFCFVKFSSPQEYNKHANL